MPHPVNESALAPIMDQNMADSLSDGAFETPWHIAYPWQWIPWVSVLCLLCCCCGCMLCIAFMMRRRRKRKREANGVLNLKDATDEMEIEELGLTRRVIATDWGQPEREAEIEDLGMTRRCITTATWGFTEEARPVKDLWEQGALPGYPDDDLPSRTASFDSSSAASVSQASSKAASIHQGTANEIHVSYSYGHRPMLATVPSQELPPADALDTSLFEQELELIRRLSLSRTQAILAKGKAQK